MIVVAGAAALALMQGIALPAMKGIYRLPIVEQHMLAIDQEIQFASDGVCRSRQREAALDAARKRWSALALEYRRRSGRDAPSQMLMVEGDGCRNVRYFRQNMRALETHLNQVERLVEATGPL